MSKLYYVQLIFLCTVQPNALKDMMHLGTYVRRAQNIQDIFLLTHQLTIIYSKMDQQYINILHAPKLDIGL